MYAEDADSENNHQDVFVKLEASSPHIQIGHTDSTGYHSLPGFALSELSEGGISLTIQSGQVAENASVTALIGNRAVGKMNIEIRECLDPLPLHLVQIIVNGREDYDITDLEKQIPILDEMLNKRSYNQAFVQWDLQNEVKVLNLTINKKNIKLLDIYKAAVKHYKDHGLNPDNENIMFVASCDALNDASGYAHLSGKGINAYAIVNRNALEYKSIAHELGHNLGLKDLNKEHMSYFFDTDNFMDYYSTYNNDNRNMFWKYQWDIIYNRVHSKQMADKQKTGSSQLVVSR